MGLFDKWKKKGNKAVIKVAKADKDKTTTGKNVAVALRTRKEKALAELEKSMSEF